MRTKPVLAVVQVSLMLAAGVVFGGCGGGSSSTHSRHARGSASIPTYHLTLSGAAETPAGAPHGSGVAVIALHLSSRQVCYRFAHLRGFTGATFAHIHKGASGAAGNIVLPLSTATKLHHRGCVAASAGLISAIQADPSGYYVNIHSVSYPAGAVRAQL